MTAIEIIQALTVLAAALSAVLAWAAKLRWSQEYAAAKDETIKARQAQIDTLNSALKEQATAKDETIHAREAQAEVLASALQQQADAKNETIRAREAQIESLNSIIEDRRQWNSQTVEESYLTVKRQLEAVNKDLEAKYEIAQTEIQAKNHQIADLERSVGGDSAAVIRLRGEKQVIETNIKALDEARSITTAARNDASQLSAIRRLSGASILWVDDRPTNNNYARKALEALGIKFKISTSTDDAINRVKNEHFDAIISDMGRPPDQQAGYTLLENLRKMENNTPFIIYAGSNDPRHNALAKQKGAYGSTGNAETLFEFVTGALTEAQVPGPEG